MSHRVGNKRRAGHPAREMVSLSQAETRAREDIINSTEWQFLPKDDKAFLLQYLIHGDYGKAMELTGVTHEWLEEREQWDDFQKLLARARSMPAQVAVNMAKEATPESMEVLLTRMRDASNKLAQLKAVEMVQKVAGIGIEEAGNVQNNQWNITVTHWNAGKEPMTPIGAEKIIEHERK